MFLNDYIWNPFNMVFEKATPITVAIPIHNRQQLGANEAAIILDAKQKRGIFAPSNSAEQYILTSIKQEMVFDKGETFLNIRIGRRGLHSTPKPERNVNVKESTLRLIMSIIRGLDNDKNLELKKSNLVMSDNYDVNKATLFTEYVSPIASTLTPEQLFLVLFLSAVLTKILDNSVDDERILEMREPVYQVANCSGIVISHADSVIDAIRMLIIELYNTSY